MLLFLLLASAQYSAAQDLFADESEISAFRRDAHRRMETALGNDFFKSVIIDPTKQLNQLEAAGIADLDRIANFQGPGDKEEAKQKSLQFWKEKMEEVIKPYVTNPENYQGLIIDHAYLSDNPTWNNTDAYKNIEKKLNAMSEEVFQKLRGELEKRAVPAGRLEDVTSATWKEMLGKRALGDAIFTISLSRQYAKNSAAGGGSPQEYMGMITTAIQRDSEEFYKRINEIYSSNSS